MPVPRGLRPLFLAIGTWTTAIAPFTAVILQSRGVDTAAIGVLAAVAALAASRPGHLRMSSSGLASRPSPTPWLWCPAGARAAVRRPAGAGQPDVRHRYRHHRILYDRTGYAAAPLAGAVAIGSGIGAAVVLRGPVGDRSATPGEVAPVPAVG